MKKKVLFTSIVTIALCLSLIAGSTFALFTSDSTVNVAITAAKVEMKASITDLELYSVKATDGGSIVDEFGGTYEFEGPLANFANGGTAILDGSVLTLKQVTPGDKVSFNVQGANGSDVTIQYRVVVKFLEGVKLMSGLWVTIEGNTYPILESYTSAWQTLEPGKNIDPENIVIEFPVDKGNEYQEESCKISITVEAVQGNADVEGSQAVATFLDGYALTKGIYRFDPTAWLADGYKAVKDGANWVVGPVNVDDIKDALANGKDVALGDDVFVSDNYASSGYGKTGINVNGQTVDGNGNAIGVNAWGTWDSAVNITGGTIKNLTINSGMRGIFVNHNGAAGKVYLENVIIDGTVYTISCDQGTNSGLEAKNSTFNGWTSYAATIGDVLFTNCSFGEGQGYAFCRPYAPTTFVGCDFEAGYEMDARAAVTFENCTIGGQPLTAANLATLVISNIGNATVK